MNSPEENIELLLPIILETYLPCESANNADKDISTNEIQICLTEHTGQQFDAMAINTWMKAHAFHERSTSDHRIVWMLKERDVL